MSNQQYFVELFKEEIMIENNSFLDTLTNYQDKGLLRSQNHPTLPLKIWNYTETCQFEKKWDDITMMCRGLVTDNNGKIIAKPFGKFFNIEEKQHKSTEEFEVFEKVDGSLGIIFLYEGKEVIATRGSFTSDQAVKAKEIFDRTCCGIYDYNVKLKPGWTYCVEIIYPANRVVVQYTDEQLILLGAFDENHNEVSYSDLPVWPHMVKRYDGLDWQNIQHLNWENSEGFVVRFSNGSRCKIKFEDYVRLHKVMTNFSSKAVFECLKKGKNLDEVLKDTPDEFYANIKSFADELKSKYKEIEDDAKSMFDAISNIKNRKKFAEEAQTTPYADLLFKMLDGEDYSDKIWRRIEPKYERLS